MDVDRTPNPKHTPTAASRWGQSWRVLCPWLTKDLALDLLERAVVLALFVHFANRMLARLVALVTIQAAHPELIVHAVEINLGAVLLVLSEVVGVALILLRRRSATMSSRPFDWALSFIAVGAPLLAVPAAPNSFIASQIATAVMLAGMVLQISAKVALARSFGIVPANRGVKTTGPYRLIRHPMYAGYTLSHIGFVIGFPSAQNALLFLMTFLIEVARLMREEAVLKHDPAYRDYVRRVRYRMLPGAF